MLSLEIDDSKKQTEQVLEKIAFTVGKNTKPSEKEYYRWQDFQIMLRMIGKERGGWTVVVPFADDLANLIRHKEAVRLRRDFSQILTAIKAHAVIHVNHRMKNEKNEIIADLDLDYEPVAKLIGPIVAEASGIAVEERMVQTIEAVKGLTKGLAIDEGTTADKVGKTLKLDTSTATRRLRAAAHRGFVTNLEQRARQPGKWRLTGKEIEDDTLLPTAEEIKTHQSSPREG